MGNAPHVHLLANKTANWSRRIGNLYLPLVCFSLMGFTICSQIRNKAVPGLNVSHLNKYHLADSGPTSQMYWEVMQLPSLIHLPEHKVRSEHDGSTLSGWGGDTRRTEQMSWVSLAVTMQNFCTARIWNCIFSYRDIYDLQFMMLP